MPDETPPARVKKPWRMPGSASIRPWVSSFGLMVSPLHATVPDLSMPIALPRSVSSIAIEGGKRKAGLRDGEDLEEIAHRVGRGKPTDGSGDGVARRGVLADGETLGAGGNAEAVRGIRPG